MLINPSHPNRPPVLSNLSPPPTPLPPAIIIFVCFTATNLTKAIAISTSFVAHSLNRATKHCHSLTPGPSMSTSLADTLRTPATVTSQPSASPRRMTFHTSDSTQRGWRSRSTLAIRLLPLATSTRARRRRSRTDWRCRRCTQRAWALPSPFATHPQSSRAAMIMACSCNVCAIVTSNLSTSFGEPN
jgi:hypothetical protein